MRVLVVTNHWDLVGGSERYAGEVVTGLSRRGFDTAVLCARGERNSDVQVHTVPELDSCRLSPGARAQLRRVLHDADRVLLLSHASADVLRELLASAPLVRFVQDHRLFCPGLNKQHANGELCQKALGSECLKRYYLDGGCCGMRITDSPSLRFPLRSLSECLRELELTRRARRVLVASSYMRDELLRTGIAPDEVEVLPYFTASASAGLAPAEFSPALEEFLARGEGALLFTPARLTLPDKGIDYLLTALGHTDSEVRLVVAGDGPARAWLEEKAAAEGLDQRVHFSGWLAPDEIESLYARCDLVVCPSVWNEPFGLVGIEAMAHGKAVVAFDCGGIAEWLRDGVTGTLCKRKDTEALARAIDRLARHPDERLRMGAAGRQRVEEEFRPRRHLDRLQEILRP